MLVVALPLKAVMLSYTDTNAAREVQGHRGAARAVRRRLPRRHAAGCADRRREDRHLGAQRGDHVRRRAWRDSAAGRALSRSAPRSGRTDRTRAGVHEPRRSRRAISQDGRIAFTENWKPEKLWDLHTPRNTVHCAALAARRGGKAARYRAARAVRVPRVLDRRPRLLPERHAASSSPPCRWTMPRSARRWPTYDGARESLERLKSFGINFVYTHNYGCEPGSHLSFAEILRAADDVGMLVALSQPHFTHYDWKRARRRPEQRLRAARRVLRPRGAEPSVGRRLRHEPQRHRLRRGHEPGHDRRHPATRASPGR